MGEYTAPSGPAMRVSAESSPENWIPIREEVLYKPARKIKIISIGAGFSGQFIHTLASSARFPSIPLALCFPPSWEFMRLQFDPVAFIYIILLFLPFLFLFDCCWPGKSLSLTGLTLANKIQRTYKLDDIVEHVLYEKNVSIHPVEFLTPMHKWIPHLHPFSNPCPLPPSPPAHKNSHSTNQDIDPFTDEPGSILSQPEIGGTWYENKYPGVSNSQLCLLLFGSAVPNVSLGSTDALTYPCFLFLCPCR